MIVPDSNLILYAYNASSREHAAARQWWADLLSGAEPVGLTHPVVFSFLRVSTNRRAFERPLQLERASALIASWLDRRVVRVLQEGRDHYSTVVRLLLEAGATGGNLVVDAQVAAAALSHRATIHTADRDFARFKGVKCRFPLDEV